MFIRRARRLIQLFGDEYAAQHAIGEEAFWHGDRDDEDVLRRWRAAASA
ncbi:hypothetical protein [Nonomuraea aurantiaca]|nr:hypothetical protein [Nonomuraea aurantiaca]MCA2230000.1 hypothetical protein [Nonomuraea aurantiaca]